MNTPSSTHFIGKVTQKVIIVHGGKVLFSRDVGDERFELPGGRLDLGEDPARGLERELHEELGVGVEVGKPAYICQTLWGSEESPHMFIAYEAKLLSPLEQVKPDGVEVEEMRWMTFEELKDVPVYQECVDAVVTYFKNT